ncbi:ABC transporter substrate-binding protein [Achromobacter sp. UMC71]|uniref:ABC transporter substrate-binding protein n=1 Tax=Achromobacter sp. UMC71 TaxID=1862320 RepID=UPI0016022919|nr:ABC transporter substrate-binding protein [Achromobacter sp. UMC71]MBB1626279.1 ABC transporter substrate-binding protein [Achromobacter sp. UMC71]
MTMTPIRGSAALLLAFAALAAHAQQKPVDIGFIGTLSTPAGYIGEDERDAFMLAVKEGGGKLGGVPVNVRVEDDALKPANAKQIADKMVQGGVRLFTGVNFSNVLAAVAPTVLNAGGFYVSLNAGPSNYAGKACNPNYFSVSFQNDSYADTAGIAANELGAKRVAVMAPNYQAGRDAVAGFKRTYKGEIAEEIYTKLDQADFSVELARIRSLNPDAIFQFHPGGAGINLTKQFANSGLSDKIKMITPIYSMDERMLAATGNAGKGFYLSSLWSADLDNAQNKHFVEAFTKAYNRAPTAYAAQAYDTANLLGTGLKAVDGDIAGKPDAFRDALRRADFPSVRGKFKFGPNQHPVQDWYLLHIEAGPDGKLVYKNLKVIARGHTDVHAADCKM